MQVFIQSIIQVKDSYTTLVTHLAEAIAFNYPYGKRATTVLA